MDDEKFEEIMENWASHEMESTPQLRPTKEMYRMVKAKNRKVLFPVFARWATVGIAAATIIVVAILHPGVFRPSTYFEQSTKTEELSVGPQKEDVSKNLAKSRITSETRKSKVVLPRAPQPRGIEGKSESYILYSKDQFAASEPLPSDKDTEGEKHVGSKTFRSENGVWVDTTHSQERELIKIKRNSQAYHDLITTMPDIKVYFEIGPNVIVNIGEYSIETADDGKTKLTQDELKQLVKE